MARVSIVLLQVFAYGYLACSASTEEDTWLETYSESTAAQASGFASTQHWRSQDPALGCYQSDTPFGSMTLTRLRSCPTRTAGQDPQQWVTDCLETFRYGPPTPPVEPGPCTAQDVGGGLALDPATALTLHTPAQGDMPSNTLLYFVKQTASPTEAPSISPTFAPSDAPTQAPTQVPTQVPTPSPTTQGGAIQDLRESVNAVMVGTGSQIAALGRQLYGLSMDVNQEEARLRAELTAAVDTQAKANAQVNDSLGRSSTKISKLTDQLAASEIKIAAVGTKVAANKQLQEQMMSMLKNKTQQLGESLQAKITTVSQALDSATTQGQGEISELKSQLKAAAQTQQQNLAALQANVTREAEKHKAAIDALSTKVDAASTSTADKIAKLKATLEGQIGVVDGRLSSFQKNEGSVNQQLTSEVSALQDKFTGEFKEQAAVNKEQAAVNKEQAQEISNQANQIKQLNISLKEQITNGGAEYEDSDTAQWCDENADVSGRNGCNSDQECLANGRALCDPDPQCFGVAWYQNRISQPLKLCRSTSMAPKTDGWRTMMKKAEPSYTLIASRSSCFNENGAHPPYEASDQEDTSAENCAAKCVARAKAAGWKCTGFDTRPGCLFYFDEKVTQGKNDGLSGSCYSITEGI